MQANVPFSKRMSVDDRQCSDPFPDPEIPTHEENGVMMPPWLKYPEPSLLAGFVPRSCTLMEPWPW